VPPDGNGARHDEYAHLVALHRRYAQSAPGDSQRQRLRDELISGYLPVAKHIARRFAGRGEPLDDLVQVATVGLIHAVDRFQPDRGSDSCPSPYPPSPARYGPISGISARRPGYRAGYSSGTSQSSAHFPRYPSTTGARRAPARSLSS
jgi:hypothetical protein